MQTFKKFFFLLNPKEQKSAVLLLILIIITALLDMIGVASILPFMAVLTNPDLIETNAFLNIVFQVSNNFGVEDHKQFIFVLGLIVFLLLIISLFFKALATFAQVRFVQMREYSIGKRLIEGYLSQPYSWFLGRNSADLGKTILSEVQQVIAVGMNPLIELIAKGMATITLITLLLIVDPKLTLIVGLSLAISYILIFYSVRKYLNRIGKERLRNNQLRFTAINEAFGAAKELKVNGLESFYIKLFSTSAKIYARTQSLSQLIGQLPRFVLEAIAFGGILLIMLYITSQTGSFNNALPIISLYVLAGYRLMPALQQIYSSLAQLSFIRPSLDKLHYELKNLQKINKNQDQSSLSFNNTIALKNISYSYPDSSRTALNGVSLIIPAKTTVGLVGTTGSGKTTMVDIILGLLEAEKGTLEVDGKTITRQNSRAWQRSIGYVPQFIYLSDDNISKNIAFGLEPNDVNQETVEKVAKIANLHEFVINELPDKYNTIIGERGVRLSGGQRQRIGIARALYHNPKILILDEATSSLDNLTEKIVMDSMYNLSKDITIILIAHRLNTVKNCDIIFKIDKGKIINQGTFDELYK